MKSTIFLFLLFCISNPLLTAQQTASELLQKSIEFHDPQSNWDKFNAELNFKVIVPEKEDTKRKAIINNEKQSFSFFAQYDEGLLVYEVNQAKGTAKWNGSEEISEDVSKKYRISPQRAIMYRDYYSYLYGMPMKLLDAGTIIHPDVEEVKFHGKSYNKIKVTYAPEVGDDIWYFYFNPISNALEAYQFFHDEAKNDGEYILFEELKEIQNVKFPRIRKWYYNKDEKFLATDELEN